MRARIRQSEIDFLCLAVFGQRSLPDSMAARIALRREGAHAIAGAFERHSKILNPKSSARSSEPEEVEALAG